MHILKQKPFGTREAVLDALNRADPEGKEWTRQRLEYQVDRVIELAEAWTCLLTMVSRMTPSTQLR
jgi:hypothetical protein